MENRHIEVESKYKKQVTDITEIAIEHVQNDDNKIGILLCEGDEYSIDKAIYSSVFPALYVVPVGGCPTVVRYTPRLRKILSKFGIYVYGIIDRDALSKKEMRNLYTNTGVHTTKLPFAENFICCPEVVEVVCDLKGLEYQVVLKRIEAELMKILWQKLKEALPINLGIEKNETILYLNIGAGTKRRQINKVVDESTILYSYRDKVIVAIVGNAVDLKGRKEYYKLIIDLLKDPILNIKLANIFANFVPKFELYDLNIP